MMQDAVSTGAEPGAASSVSEFAVFSGNYGAMLPALSFGVNGGILAVANIAPNECVQIYELAAFAGGACGDSAVWGAGFESGDGYAWLQRWLSTITVVAAGRESARGVGEGFERSRITTLTR